MRIALTSTKARQLQQARSLRKWSQYQLAEELGWPRSKIKRIEKFEVQTIEEEDLQRLEKALAVQVLAPKASGKSGTRLSEPHLWHTDPDQPLTEGKLFVTAKQIRRPTVVSENQVFLRVSLGVNISVKELLGKKIELSDFGLKGSGMVRGVETNDPIRVGEKVTVMIWGDGLALQNAL